MAYPYRGSRALVTGASSGIGADVAVALAQRGVNVALTARRREQLDVVAERCRDHGVSAHVLPADLGDLDAAGAVGRRAIEALGGLDLLVNSAGAPRRVHAARLTFAQVEETMRVNYLGTMAVIYAVLPHMLEKKKGRIVNVSSIAGRLPAPREMAYAASKAALTMASEVLAEDLMGTGIRIHVIHPGVIDTPLWDAEGQEASPFRGAPTPVGEVTAAILKQLDTGAFDAYVPRKFRLAVISKPLLGDRFVASSSNYDRKRVPEAYR